MPNFLTPVLQIAKTQLAALAPTIKNLITNTPAPARQTVFSTILLIGIGWVVFKIIKKVSG
jgi:hypothetical protein